MSFFDFLLKFWWIEIIALAVIFYSVYANMMSIGIALIAAVGSFIMFWILSQSGLE